MTFDYFTAYFFILFVATITPGPSMFLAINHGVNHGIVKSLYSALGNLTGNLLMAFISIAGLGVILVTSGIIFNIIKWIGIAYLIYVGLKLILSPVKAEESVDNTNQKKYKTSRTRLFIDGFIIAIGNPKGILFFTALFPQFIDVKNVTISSFLVVFITLGIVAFGCYMLYAIFGAKLNRFFRLKTFRKIFNRVTGSILIGTGLTVAFSKK